MNGCTSLTSIDLSGLRMNITIDHNFLEGCSILRNIKCSQEVKNKIEKK
jgi:hypothetical protein